MWHSSCWLNSLVAAGTFGRDGHLGESGGALAIGAGLIVAAQ